MPLKGMHGNRRNVTATMATLDSSRPTSEHLAISEQEYAI